jgi:D-ribose pyranase
MKKTGILNKDISTVIASMGHLDQLTICDAGLPIPEGVRRIDLAILPGIPSFLQVVKAVAADLKVQQIIMADELRKGNPALVKEITKIFGGIEVVYKPHDEFKLLSSKSRAIIRTGECTPYANIILVSGVTF